MGCSASNEQAETVSIPSAATLEDNRTTNEVEEGAQLLDPHLNLSSKIEITLSCNKLTGLDTKSKSDPFIVFYSKTKGNWIEQGRTEVLIDNSDPQFTKHFPFTYRFEEQQLLKFDVFDADGVVTSSEGLDLSKQDYVGGVEIVLANVASSPSKMVSLPLKCSNQTNRGDIKIQIEEMCNQNANIRCQMQVRYSQSGRYFIQISRTREQGTPDACYRTAVRQVANDLLLYPEYAVHIQPLCNGDIYRPLLFDLYQWGKNGEHKLMGQSQSNLKNLMDKTTMTLKSSTGAVIGSIDTLLLEIIPQPTFLDFISGGTELNFMVAIDFTGSNGNPSEPGTLHYISPVGEPNQYEMAIRSVANVIQCYDTDKKFPVYGFGGRVEGGVSHCFPLTFSANPEVIGVDGIINIYHDALQKVGLSGPTIFSQVIRSAASIAQFYQSQKANKYLILLIITDGIINDMSDTINAIIDASGLPISLLIVGVGNADFSGMNELDAEKHPLVSQNGLKPKRTDIVQFVPLREYLGKDPLLLSKALLEELPVQLLEYMKMNGILPQPPRRS